MARSSSVLDLASRVALFMLSALSALAIFGAIAAIPSDVARNLARQGSPAVERAEEAGPPSGPAGAADEPTTSSDQAAEADGSATGTLPLSPPSPDERIAEWLEVIAYALIANAGLMALFGLALLRRR